MSFSDRLLEATTDERERFLAIPIIRRAAASGVSRDAYVAFLTQAYHHVRYTCPLLELALARCGPEDDHYRDGLLQYIAEEAGHEEWILDDIEAFGGSAAAVRTAVPGVPCRAMVGYATYVIEHVSPYALLGMVHVLEGMSAQLASAAAQGIARALGRDTNVGFSYLVSHGALDQDHVRFFADLVDAIRDARAQRAIIDTANVIYRLYGDIFRDIDRETSVADAAA
jgi:pyrroloquinoline quinone (PQQ) biosynthesis protein C